MISWYIIKFKSNAGGILHSQLDETLSNGYTFQQGHALCRHHAHTQCHNITVMVCIIITNRGV